MPRKKNESTPPPEPGFRCTGVPFEGIRAVTTIGPEHPIWTGGTLDSVKDAFVRVDPPEDVEEEIVKAVVESVLKFAPLKVTVLPRNAAKVVLLPSGDEMPRPPPRTHRQVVRGVVERANHPDRPALLAYCEAVMDRASC